MKQDLPMSIVPKLTKLKALGMLIGAMGMSAGFIALCGALGNHDSYAGLLFLLCFAVLEKSSFTRLPHAILGCAFGLSLGYLLQYLIGHSVQMGGLIFVAVIMVVLYCQFLEWLPYIANLSAFSFVLVTTIPYVQAQSDFRNPAIALVIGIVYFVPIMMIAAYFSQNSKRHA